MWPALLLVVWGCATTPRHPSVPLQRPRAPIGLTPTPGVSGTIVVDAGHGGKDPGTQHNGLREKDLNLDIVRRLRTELKARGLAAVLTRDRDEFIPLSQRPDVANRIAADLFVSVHINASRNRRVSGFEVYYPRESVVNGATAGLPPGVEPAEVAQPSASIRQILWDLFMRHSRRDSTRMASYICRSMRERVGARCRGIKGARFVVLREAQMPAVLVEVGYVTNRSDAARLASPSYRQAVAEAIADGVAAYLRERNGQRKS